MSSLRLPSASRLMMLPGDASAEPVASIVWSNQLKELRPIITNGTGMGV